MSPSWPVSFDKTENGRGLKWFDRISRKWSDWDPSERHPWYGPCDGISKDGCCSECLQTIHFLVRETLASD